MRWRIVDLTILAACAIAWADMLEYIMVAYLVYGLPICVVFCH